MFKCYIIVDTKICTQKFTKTISKIIFQKNNILHIDIICTLRFLFNQFLVELCLFEVMHNFEITYAIILLTSVKTLKY